MVTGDLLHHHRAYVSDVVAQALYRKAIHKVVRPGDTVLDLGSGTGLHAIEACRAGAKTVYAVECGDIAVLAREIVRRTPFRDRIKVIQEHSSFVRLPRKVDVIVAYLGPSDLVRSLGPARARWLRPGGRTIPSRLRFRFGPVEAASLYRREISWWRNRDGVPWEDVRRWVSHTSHATQWRPSHFLARARGTLPIPLDGWIGGRKTAAGTFATKRSGTLHGIGLWAETQLAPGLWLTARPPLRLSPAVHRHAFLPLERPARVGAGQRLRLRVTLVPTNEWIWRWQVSLEGRRLDQSSLSGLLLSPGHLRAGMPSSRSSLTARGEATRLVLDLCRRERSLNLISLELMRRHHPIFRRRAEALAFAQGILSELAEHR